MRRCVNVFGLAALLTCLAGCAASDTARVPEVAAPLRVPPTQVLSLRVRATGVQVYVCTPDKADSTRSEWVFSAPTADLFDRSGKRMGRHYAGPTWEADDGSKVVGEVVARDGAPDSSAIPWLLLRATSATGHGILNQTRSIQRLHTVGGKAPADGCSAARSGAEARVPYTADYLFYRERR